MEHNTNNLPIQLTIIVTKVPENTTKYDDIYISGDFNNWLPDVENCKLTKNPNKTYSVTITTTLREFEYKFTRGDWRRSELWKVDDNHENHKFVYENKDLLSVKIKNWEDRQHTSTNNVITLSKDFLIPQLNRRRKVSIYLPPDYNDTAKKYPVLYMQDGQNLFDNYYSYDGEWAVDKALNRLFYEGYSGAIVVAIDNGKEQRNNEYLPWKNSKYGGGKGKKYAKFIVKTLKPYIDKHFRTLSDRKNTGIMGSSLGGVISLYTALNYQKVFSKVGVFSPCFHELTEMFEYVENNSPKKNIKIFFLAGVKEENGYMVVESTKKMATLLQICGLKNNQLKLIIKADGTHNEAFWRREFRQAFEWLYTEKTI